MAESRERLEELTRGIQRTMKEMGARAAAQLERIARGADAECAWCGTTVENVRIFSGEAILRAEASEMSVYHRICHEAAEKYGWAAQLGDTRFTVDQLTEMAESALRETGVWEKAEDGWRHEGEPRDVHADPIGAACEATFRNELPEGYGYSLDEARSYAEIRENRNAR